MFIRRAMPDECDVQQRTTGPERQRLPFSHYGQ